MPDTHIAPEQNAAIRRIAANLDRPEEEVRRLLHTAELLGRSAGNTMRQKAIEFLTAPAGHDHA